MIKLNVGVSISLPVKGINESRSSYHKSTCPCIATAIGDGVDRVSIQDHRHPQYNLWNCAATKGHTCFHPLFSSTPGTNKKSWQLENVEESALFLHLKRHAEKGLPVESSYQLLPTLLMLSLMLVHEINSKFYGINNWRYFKLHPKVPLIIFQSWKIQVVTVQAKVVLFQLLTTS